MSEEKDIHSTWPQSDGIFYNTDKFNICRKFYLVAFTRYRLMVSLHDISL